MIIDFFYPSVLVIGFLFYFPKIVLRKKAGPSLKQRLGLFDAGKTKSKPLLFWIHSVSLGETKAVLPLVKRLKQHYGDEAEFIHSTCTATGYEEGKKALPFCLEHLYLPLDLKWIMRKWMRRFQPDHVIISETDLWRNFLAEAKRQGATCTIVNGKMSEKSCQMYESLPMWGRHIFSFVDLVAVQSPLYKKRYQRAGVAEDKIAVTGNLKIDQVTPEIREPEKWKRSLGLSEEDQILVIGSSHDPEERWLLEVLDSLWGLLPHLKVMLVPRHPERFDAVASLLEECGQPYIRLSSLEKKPFKILLIDQMGVLKSCYQIADVCLVAGSYLEKVGGHNILEPAEFGKPVIFGPCMSSQPELLELCKTYESGLQVEMKDLHRTLLSLMPSQTEKERLGRNGKRLIEDHRGATEKTFALIEKKTKEPLA